MYRRLVVRRHREGCRRPWQLWRWDRPKDARRRLGRSRQEEGTAVNSAAWVVEVRLALGVFG